MTSHRLDPLLQPTSIALMGVSERAGSPGRVLAEMLLDSAYGGTVYLVNPRYAKILGRRCYPGLEALPERVEHVVIALGNPNLESALEAGIAHGARAATIYSSGHLQGDSELGARLQRMAEAAKIEICGINGMGFYNINRQLYAGIFPRAGEIIKGGVSYIAQSGSAFTTLCHNGCRLGFNLCVSAGNEITTSVADYMDWSLEQDDTRVIGLFLETVRDPRGFVAALEKARHKNVPVVVLKIGKSPEAAAMAITHTGAIAGNHAVFQALFKRYGVIEVEDFDEMTAVLMLLQSGRAAHAGDFAAVFESGGFREMVTDEASRLGIDFAPLEDATRERLKHNLDPGLEAENPLDAWGSHANFKPRFEACLEALMQDPNVAAGAFISNYRDGYYLSEAIYTVVETVSKKTDKPIALGSCYSDLANPLMCRRAHAAGIALLDGSRETLLAFKHLLAYRDFKNRKTPQPATPVASPGQISDWTERLSSAPTNTLGEAESLALLDAFALPVVRHEVIAGEAAVLAAAERIGFPLVLKTAEPGIHHKTESKAVFVDIRSADELRVTYRNLEQQLGPAALLSAMFEGGIEIGLGTVNDAQFGPIIMVAAGGVMVEMLDDRAVALCPVSPAEADDMLKALKLNHLLSGLRGKPAVNRQALIDCIVKLSMLAFELKHSIAEIDINPVIVNPHEARAVDALVLRRDPAC